TVLEGGAVRTGRCEEAEEAAVDAQQRGRAAVQGEAPAAAEADARDREPARPRLDVELEAVARHPADPRRPLLPPGNVARFRRRLACLAAFPELSHRARPEVLVADGEAQRLAGVASPPPRGWHEEQRQRRRVAPEGASRSVPGLLPGRSRAL